MDIREIIDPQERAALCERILRALPAWFGIESALMEYVREARTLPVLAAYTDGEATGFLALKAHTPCAAEVCVMGVLPGAHRRGMGRALIEAAADRCLRDGRRFLTVKTLDASADSIEYGRTRAFYQAMGFLPLEVFPTLWGANNPCLLMIRPLA